MSITVGSDGALWFAEVGSEKIGRLTTSGALREYRSCRTYGLSDSCGRADARTGWCGLVHPRHPTRHDVPRRPRPA